MTVPESPTEAALYTTLTGGTALTALLAGTASVYNTVIPAGASYPCVVFNLAAGLDANDEPGHRRHQEEYQVKVVDQTSMAHAGSVAAQIDTLLHAVGPGTASNLSVSGYRVLFQERVRPVRYVESSAEGQRFYHAGGIYRVRLEEGTS